MGKQLLGPKVDSRGRVVKVEDRFTEEQKKDVIAMHNSGMTQGEIANEFADISRRSIGKLCDYLGLSRTVRQAAKLGNPNKYDHSDLSTKIKELIVTKIIDEIAVELGVGPSTVHRICCEYNIEIPDRGDMIKSKLADTWTDQKRQEASDKAREVISKLKD